MPKVGSKDFPYTRSGIADAKAEAQATGQPLKARKSYADTARAQVARAKARKSEPEGRSEPGDSPAEDSAEKSLGGSGVTIQDAIKHPGALTAKAKAAGQSIDDFAAAHQHDKGQTGEQARFYLGVLKKAGK